ncbi:hypothetical protein [Sphingobium sp. YR657]|uniref:hypothetical protein n=1 Tax=Sphingobium sp. YR657 TaxID=1884366 RepID=UPI003137C64C
MLVSTAAMPSRNDPSIITIADSFPALYVRYMFAICSHVGKRDFAMCVSITPIPDSVRLAVSGDVETVLTVPYDEDERFLVGLSDGTLLIGHYDEAMQCRWEVARDGAGIVRFDGNAARVEWRVEWLTVATFDANVVEPGLPPAVPLFPELDRWAA